MSRGLDRRGVNQGLSEPDESIMVKDQEVERLAKKLDKMVQKKNTDGAIDLLRELKNIKMSLETLQSTRVGMSVNAVRKQTSDEEVQTLAKTLIKSWKRLVDSSNGKSDEKKQEASRVRSSSTSKDSGTSEKSSKKSEDRPGTPTTPTTPTPVTPTTPTPRITTFPPPPANDDNVRNRCRQMLVAALQTDGDHKTIGADCEHLATEIEDYIYQEYQCTDMKYKSRLRSRISNLKDQKNPELRRNVLRGSITAQRIASMCAEEMASAELKQIRETMTKDSIRQHQLSKPAAAEEDAGVGSTVAKQ